MKSLWTLVRELIDMIDWWVALAMLLILGLGLAVLVSVIRWLL
jgi:hypothetical protein